MRKLLWTAIVMLLSLGSILAAGLGPQAINLPEGGFVAADDDEEKPEVTARVARISFVRGDVQVKRAGSEDWETGVLNLPLIEGDEIATGADARVELQFNSYVHIRLASDALLKLTVVKDEGVAVSLSQGTLSLRVTDMDKAGGYLEIDAPKTTLAVETAGSYRIDAGKAGDTELRVSVAAGGSARVYSENAGFTLKSGRSARVFIDGDNSGEWETAAAAKFGDDLDAWNADRDAVIAQRLKAAHYSKYYDQDIYGADDLTDNGEWVYTSSYGYVWRPFASSINSYANWSPYRYGHWRWLGVYGWTWINDEPWGWATYHHGRWIYDSGYWVWCPYSYYRPRHSWWYPALVSITIINNNICWYPLSYRHRWRNYNGYGGNGGGPRSTDRQPQPGGLDVNAKKRPPVTLDLKGSGVPLGGVVTVDSKDFGVTTGGVRTAPADLAKRAIENPVTGTVELPPARRSPAADSEIAVKKPIDTQAKHLQTGTAARSGDAALDGELRTKRIFGDRRPVAAAPEVNDAVKDRPATTRTIGAVDRPARPKDAPEIKVRPVERGTDRTPRTVEPEAAETRRAPRPPVVTDRAPPPRQVEQERRPAPSHDTKREPPTRSTSPRSEPPTKTPETPKVTDRKADAKDGR